jgi:uncharacterized repeat protein (TIGR01451 family)
MINRTSRVTALLLPFVAALAVAAAPAAAAPAPGWSIHVVPGPTVFTPGDTSGNDVYQILVTNLGGAATSGIFTVRDTLPAGLTPDPGPVQRRVGFETCTTAGQTVTCTGTEQLPPGEFAAVDIPVDVSPGAASSLTDVATVTGGGAPYPVTTTSPTTVGGPTPPFGLLPGSAGEQLTIVSPDGTPAAQAGSHPSAVQSNFDFNMVDETGPFGEVALYPHGHVRDLTGNLPQGLIVDPDATAVKCTEAELEADGPGEPGCPAASQVGVVELSLQLSGVAQPQREPRRTGHASRSVLGLRIRRRQRRDL